MGDEGVGPRRLDALTGLRWWAAFAVFCGHITYLAPLPLLSHVHWLGWSGVAFFFVLSGFVLRWSAHPSDTPRAFYRRRFARIYPAYLVSVLVALPVFYGQQGWWFQRPMLYGVPLLLCLLLLQGWFPWIPAVFFAGNPAGWTLSDEAFFYAVFPRLRRSSDDGRRSARAAVLLLALAWLPALVAVVLPDGGVVQRLAAQSPLSTLPLFLAGVCLASAVRAGWRPRYSGAGAAAVLLLALAATWLASTALGLTRAAESALLFAATAPGFAAVIVCVALAERSGGARLLRSRLQVRLGEWSYAFYLVHATAIYAAILVLEATGWQPPVALLDVGVLAAAIGAAVLLHHLVEVPAERRLRGHRRTQLVDLREGAPEPHPAVDAQRTTID